MNAQRDQAEFNGKMSVIDSLTMKTKRQLYSAMRNDAAMHMLVPRLGMTLGEVCCFLVLRDRA